MRKRMEESVLLAHGPTLLQTVWRGMVCCVVKCSAVV